MKITDEYGNVYTVNEPLSAGGQGAVFRTEENPKLLMKAIVNADDKIICDEKKYGRFEDGVLQVIALGDIKNIARPLCLLKKPFCGYIMRLMENMQAIEKIMLPKEKNLRDHFLETGGLEKRLLVLKQFAKTLTELYVRGIVYCDISPKNLFVSEKTDSHEAWLIDIDNMNYETDSELCIGTPSYMAPEVYMGKKNTMKSDVYSFALVAYELLTYSKPFEGKTMYESEEDDWGDDWDVDDDEDSLSFDEKVARGLLPWVLQKDDTSNARIKGMGIPPEAVMTPRMLELFDQTFGVGRTAPAKRPDMSQWYRALKEACDSMLTCKNEHYHLGGECFLCGEKSDFYVAEAYYLSETDGGEFEAYDRSQVFAAEKNVIPISNGLFMDDDELFTSPMLRLRYDKKKSKYEIDNGGISGEFKFLMDPKDGKNLEKIVINVNKYGKTVKRIRFRKESADGVSGS